MNHRTELSILAVCGILLGSIATAVAADSGSRPELRTFPEMIAPAPPDNGSQPACAGPRKYVEAMDAISNGRRPAQPISSLFAENAVHYGPDGITRRGRAVLEEFYTTSLPKRRAHIYVTFAMQEGRNCILEIAAGRPGSPTALRAIDHYTVDAQGKIEYFIVFASPPASLPKDDLSRVVTDYQVAPEGK